MLPSRAPPQTLFGVPTRSPTQRNLGCMKTQPVVLAVVVALSFSSVASAQIGRRFPSEKRVVTDPVTGVPLTFLTSTSVGDSKIYPTHPQWTADGKWLIFRSQRAPGQAFAVNEVSGDIVQVTESGYVGMLCVAPKSMRLFFTRPVNPPTGAPAVEPNPTATPARPGRQWRLRGPAHVVVTDLGKLLADSQAGTMRPAAAYEQVLGTIPVELGDAGDLALDATEEVVYFRVNRATAAKHLPPDAKIETNFGPRNMGAGPTGIGRMDLKTGEVGVVVAVPFQIGHIQSNPFVPGEVVFCWETGGKAPQRTWTVMADGTGLRPLYPEQPFDWVTHEAVITKDEVALAILGHRQPGADERWQGWGPAGTREHPTGLGIVNLRTRQIYIAGQTKSGSGFWHVHGSADGRWAVGDDFARNVFLIDRNSNEIMLLSSGHKVTAADHPHPSFSPDSRKVEIQSAMLSEDGRALNICVIPVPEAWLKRTYPAPAPTSPAGP